jgi:hypothetical protein
MPRRFEVSFESPASVEQVHAAFGTENYWLDRLAAFGDRQRSLDALTVGPDGTVCVTCTEDLRHGALPGALTTVYRGDLHVVSTEKWTPLDDDRVGGEVRVAVTGAPGSGHGAAELARAGHGSRLHLSGTVQFNVPLVGGRIENYLAAQFADGLGEIQKFTTTWIGEHA